jgi:hypothetical protein
MVRLLIGLALGTVVAFSSLSGCARGEAGFVVADPRADPGERILQLRAAARSLVDELPRGEGERRTQVELVRFESFVAKAEALFRAGQDPELRDLLLDTAEGELSTLKAIHAREKVRAETRAVSGRPRSFDQASPDKSK